MRRGRDPPVLVDDLIPIILESHDHWWPRDFQRLALISPAWVEAVRKQLYAHPSLRSFNACVLFARSLLENPALLIYLRGLDIRPLACGRRTLDEREMRSLRYILGLKSLESVTLGGDLAVSAERFLHFMADTHTITSLHIDGSFFLTEPVAARTNGLPPLEWGDVIPVRFRSLHTLVLSNVALTIYPPSLDVAGELSNLTLNNVEIVDGFFPDLCRGSWQSLRVLDIVGRPTAEMDEQFRSMLEACGQLEDLRYEAVEISTHPSLFDGDDDPPPCPTLRKLCIVGFAASPLTLQAISRSYPKLVDLSVLGRMSRLPYEQWASFIKSGALPCLQRLAVSAGRHHPQEEDQLRDACCSQKVEIYIFFGGCGHDHCDCPFNS